MATDELKPGTVLNGRYEIVESLSAGAMGRVYKAKHQLMKRAIAIKAMQPHLVASEAAQKRFQQEAETLGNLKHPNVISVYDFFVEDDKPYLVMDYLDGTNLEEVLKAGPIEPERAVKIFSQACAGLAAAHEAEITHRDIKPSNIMLVKVGADEDFVKVIDFGIAKTPEHLTATGDTFGTPQYMSPEQCHAQPLDARSDVYSLGCVMYTSLTGKPPFSADDAMQVMYKHAHDPAPPFPESSTCPRSLQAVVFKSMEKDAGNRFQSMEEMKAAITSALGTPESAFAPPAKVVKLDPKHAAIAGAAGVLIAIGIGFTTVHHNREQPTPRPTGSVATAPVAAQPVASAPSPPSQPSPPVNEQPVAAAAPQAVSQSPAPAYYPQQQRRVPQQRSWTPSQLYEAYMDQGKKYFAAGDYDQAKLSFNAAHRASQGFGENDLRYLDSMEWQGKVALRLGELSLARQAFTYVSEVLKSRGESGTAHYREVEKFLKAVDEELHDH